jgi:hypothetical protein
MNKLIARQITEFSLETLEKSTSIISSAKSQLSDQELQGLALSLGNILGAFHLLTKPIYDEYPSLKPTFLDDDTTTHTACPI